MVDYLTEYLLIGLDAALYALLVFQLLRLRVNGHAGPLDAGEAFADLGVEIRHAIPSIPLGYTWREAVSEAKKLKINVDWPKVDRAVAAFEGYRYGGREDPRTGYEEIQTLARRLRRRR